MKAKRIILAICVLFNTCLGLAASDIHAEEDQVIKVGYPIQEGLTDIDENGNLSGYTYEYIQEMALYNGWQVEFVQAEGSIDESLITLMDMLEKGEIDLMGGMSYSAAMDDIYDYSSRSYGIAYTTLVILNNKTFIVDSTQMQHVRIAVHKNANMRLRELNEFCEMNLIEPEYFYYDSTEAMLNALTSGEAEAMLSTSAEKVDGVRTVAKFAPKPFYFITTSGNSSLIQEINLALQNIEQTNPYFMSEMESKYFSHGHDELILNDDELAFIEQGNVFKAGVLTNQPPFQYEANGELKGIAVDVLKAIAEKTGLNIELIAVSTPGQLDQMMADKEIDISLAMTYDYDLAEELRIQMTNPYLEAQYIMMMNDTTNTDDLRDKTLALTKTVEYSRIETSSTKWYDTIEECVKAVNNGEADYMFGDNYMVQYFINQPQFSNVYLIPQTYDVRRICFGVVRQPNHHLLNIMNKAVMAFPDEEMQTIIFLNTTYDNDYNVKDLINKYPLTFIFMISSVSAVIILALLWGLRTKIKMSNKIQLDLKKHLQVYELSSDHFFEYDYASDILMISRKGAGGESVESFTKHGEMSETDKRGQFYEQVFFKLLKEGKDTSHDLLCPMENGDLHWYRFIFKTVCDDLGNPADCIGKISDIDDEKKEKERLEKQAQLDSLTGVYNAAASRMQIIEELNRLAADQHDGLMLIDIDDFKHINDSYGHLNGDKVLCNLAQLLKNNFDAQRCLIGRPGGDEFVVYVRDTNREELGQLCEKLLACVADMVNDDEIHVSVSIGAAIASAGDRFETIYQRSDEAMYNSKRNGRNCYEIIG